MIKLYFLHSKNKEYFDHTLIIGFKSPYFGMAHLVNLFMQQLLAENLCE